MSEMTPREHMDAVCDRVGAADVVVHAALAAWEADRAERDALRQFRTLVEDFCIGQSGDASFPADDPRPALNEVLTIRIGMETHFLRQRVAALLPLAREGAEYQETLGDTVPSHIRAALEGEP